MAKFVSFTFVPILNIWYYCVEVPAQPFEYVSVIPFSIAFIFYEDVLGIVMEGEDEDFA